MGWVRMLLVLMVDERKSLTTRIHARNNRDAGNYFELKCVFDVD